MGLFTSFPVKVGLVYQNNHLNIELTLSCIINKSTYMHSRYKKKHPKVFDWHLVTRTGFEPVNACVKGM